MITTDTYHSKRYNVLATYTKEDRDERNDFAGYDYEVISVTREGVNVADLITYEQMLQIESEIKLNT